MSLVNVLPIVLIVLVFWLLIVRPQRRRQQSMAATQSALEVGSEVMLGSGIYGRVASVDEEETTILVELAPGTVVKVAKQAVIRVIEPAARDDETETSGLDGSPEEPEGGPDDSRRPDQP